MSTGQSVRESAGQTGQGRTDRAESRERLSAGQRAGLSAGQRAGLLCSLPLCTGSLLAKQGELAAIILSFRHLQN